MTPVPDQSLTPEIQTDPVPAVDAAIETIHRFMRELTVRSYESKQVRATLIVNFGREHGKKIDGVEVDESQSTMNMMVDAFGQFMKKLHAGRRTEAALRERIKKLEAQIDADDSFWHHVAEDRE